MKQEARPFVAASEKQMPARVVVVVPALGAGGTEHVVSLVANHWARQGVAVTILTLETPSAKPYYAFSPDIEIVRLGVPSQRSSKIRAGWLSVQRILRLRKAVTALQPDFVLSFLTRTNALTL